MILMPIKRHNRQILITPYIFYTRNVISIALRYRYTLLTTVCHIINMEAHLRIIFSGNGILIFIIFGIKMLRVHRHLILRNSSLV